MSDSVLLADFQFLTREGITALINSLPDFYVAHIVRDSDMLADAINNENPDLVVLDISDKEPSLIDQLEKVKKKTNCSFLIISNSQSKESIQRLLGMGIKGVVTKNCSEDEIINALRAVKNGNRFFCNNILDLVVDSQKEEEDCEPTSLSPREYQVLQLITKGKKTNQIAEKLHVSVHTINSHRKNILKKLNIQSPAELIVYALESGLVKNEVKGNFIRR
ncbi:MAG: response regulator transcription factor [Bacteroidota bacterium]